MNPSVSSSSHSRTNEFKKAGLFPFTEAYPLKFILQETSLKRSLKRSKPGNLFILAEAEEDDDEEEDGFVVPDRVDLGEEEDEAFERYLAKELSDYASTEAPAPTSDGTSRMFKDADGFWVPSLFDDIEARYARPDGSEYHGIQSPTPTPLSETPNVSEGVTVSPDMVSPLSPIHESESPKSSAETDREGEEEAEAEGEGEEAAKVAKVAANEVEAGEKRRKRRKRKVEDADAIFEADPEVKVDPSLAAFYEQL
ncbi:hypothetical protein GYMLUDRAFT_249305 [Collybiopsis luxurians FD-317 M1]|uniref:Uncharacterized protein n=1 Tax=Collybiopsis luxurians FD-317 M1 TaxID=944289 RepID=A0A0D0AVQ1_9AGAR|nr:hypothetical protein GYMLUDRAFT_249305 [Collybiopsis luxurians FD-317 M1]